MAEQPHALLEFVERYGPLAGEEGPVRFVREVFGIEPDDWQEKALRAYGRGERRIAIRSAHGVGKTACASWKIVYQLLCRFPQKTVATAPSSGQLSGALVPEVKMWMKRLPPALLDLFEIKANGIYLRAAPEESFFEARTSRAENPEALQGIHSEHVLLVADEASGVPEAVYEAAVGSMSGHNATTLLIGNPVRTSGLFFDAFHSMRDMWFTMQVRAACAPWPTGIPSERAIPDFVEQVKRTYGEKSNAYRIRCLGEFPAADDDVVVPFEWIEAARQRDVEDSPNTRRVWGLDVARFGSDRCALAERTKRTGRVLDVWGYADIMETAGRVKARWDDTPDNLRPRVILVDVIGLGSGVVDRLRELKLPVKGINVSEVASLSQKFMRGRDELWWRCREWLEPQDVSLEPGEDSRDDLQEILAGELVMPRYKFLSNGKIQTEPKESVKKRLRKSPDVADAFVLTFAEDLSRALYGMAGSLSRDEPIKRGLSIV